MHLYYIEDIVQTYKCDTSEIKNSNYLDTDVRRKNKKFWLIISIQKNNCRITILFPIQLRVALVKV